MKRYRLVLVLEDEPVCHQIVVRFAESIASSVISATSVMEAKRLLDNSPVSPDLIISDCMLEDGSPMGLVKKLASENPCEVILMSADPDIPQIGQDASLEKPFSAEKLEASLKNGNESGFTLIEVLAAVTILAIMFSMIYGVITSISSAKSNIESANENLRSAQNLLSRMSRELGTAQSVKLSGEDREVFIGEGSSGLGAQTDSVTFSALTGALDTGISNSNAGLIEINYRLERTDDRDRYELVRTEKPAGITDSNTRQAVLEKRTFEVVLAKNVAELNFRYFDEQEWKNSWEDKNQLPKAVEIAISLVTDSGIIENWKSAVALPDSKD